MKQSSSPFLSLRKASFRLGDRLIFENTSWVFQRSEHWAIIGPNGSGKTTLLSLILGDHPQAYGNDITVFGKKRGGGVSVWEIKRHIGWVSPELHQHYDDEATCFEVAASGFYDTVGLFRKSNRRQRMAALDWLAKFQVLEFADTQLCALSTGLQRMVLLARALVKQPRLLILDEPCQGLDRAHRRLFLEAVDELIRSGTATVIYVTHRKEEVPRSVKRVLRLQEGRAQTGYQRH